MKRILSLCLVLIICIGLVGCGDSSNVPSDIKDIETKITAADYEISVDKEDDKYNFIYLTAGNEEMSTVFRIALKKDNESAVSIVFYNSVKSGNKNIINQVIYRDIIGTDIGFDLVNGDEIVYAYNFDEEIEDEFYYSEESYGSDYYSDNLKETINDSFKTLTMHRNVVLEKMDLDFSDLFNFSRWYLQNN